MPHWGQRTTPSVAPSTPPSDCATSEGLANNCHSGTSNAALLMLDGVSSRYSESDGIVFTAPAEYVAKMKRQLTTCYGCRVEPIVNEYKKLLC